MVAQLNRWMVEEVLAAISMSQRRNLKIPGRIALHTALRSVRVQHPGPDVAEVSAHVAIGKQSAAMAFRLEALGDRWLCTALELAPPRGFKGLVPRADDRSRGVGFDQTGC